MGQLSGIKDFISPLFLQYPPETGHYEIGCKSRKDFDQKSVTLPTTKIFYGKH